MVVFTLDRRTGAPLPFSSQQGGTQIHLCLEGLSQLHSHGPRGKPSHMWPPSPNTPLMTRMALQMLEFNERDHL